jgi:hypothetical protein
VHFSADHADVDLEARRATLRGHVVVTATRATLRAESLELRYLDDDKIAVQGPAELAWCDAPRPPLTLRFGEVTLARDEVVARRITLLAFGRVPVGYLPWIALRGPSRWGLLPPAVALRAQDGVLVSAGVHAPVADGVGLDLRPGLYLRGGEEVRGTLRTPGGELAFRWDDTTSALVSARGNARAGEHVLLEIDALRGDRGARGTSEVDAVARPYDRAVVSVQDTGVVSAGASLRIAAPRRTGELVYAPRLLVATGRTVGPFVASGVAELGTFFDARGVGRPLARLDRDVTGAAFAGPVRMRGTFRGAVLAEGSDELRMHSFGMGLVDVGVPLSRAFGTARHVVDPGLAVATTGAVGSSTLPNGQGAEQRHGLSTVPFARVATSLVGRDVRAAARVAGGTWVRQGGGRAVYRAAAVVDAEAGAVRADWYGVGTTGTVATLLVDAGGAADANVYGLLAYRRGEDSVVARGLAADLPFAASTGSYGATGLTQSAGLRVPLAASLAFASQIDGDLDSGVIFGGSLGLGYVHVCGCLGASVVSSSRIGRPGVDTLFLVDLAPLPGTRPLGRARWN